jgi:hydrogenase maturation protease
LGSRLAAPGETLVVGLGNPILGDDGVGWRVIDELDRSEHPGASLQQACVGGINLMEIMVGYRRAIIVDAVIDPDAATGSVWCRPLADVETRIASHLDSSHDATLSAALAAGHAMGAQLPSEIDVVGIVIAPGDTFSESLSEVVEAAIPVAAAAVEETLRSGPTLERRERTHA